MANLLNERPAEMMFTWEEVSWMTGLSIDELLELFGRDVQKGATYETLPPAISLRTLENLVADELALLHYRVN